MKVIYPDLSMPPTRAFRRRLCQRHRDAWPKVLGHLDEVLRF